MDSCIFCKIIQGEVQSFKVLEDENHLAFLTIMPFKEGHTLVIPKKHRDYIFDLDEASLGAIMAFSKKVAALLKDAFKPQSGKVGIVVGGEEVPHIHIHLVPFDDVSQLSYSQAKAVSNEELTVTLEKIKSVLSS